MEDIINIAEHFIDRGKVIGVNPLGDGNINQTFLVTVENEVDGSFVLQQINTQVFTQPELVMDNLEILTRHVRDKLSCLKFLDNRCWQTPEILLTSEQKHHFVDENNNFWRAISFIEGATFYSTIQSWEHAEEIGIGLGLFHSLISDLDVEKLADTLPGFHIAPEYFKQYQQASKNTSVVLSPEVRYCQQFIQDRVKIISVLEKAKADCILKLRPIHGDPKINNIAIDNNTNKAIAMLDLDTIKPGLIHYDIGDCLRSSCNVLGEETKDWQQVTFDLDLAQAVLQGYLKMAADFITVADKEYIYDSIRLITFELGMRFFTDYLNQNIYFKANYPEHNLNRALVQFQLVKSIEEKEQAIRNLINK